MENVVIRNIGEKDIPSVVDIQISGWQTTYKGIIDNRTLNSMNRDNIIAKRKKDYKEDGFIVAELNNEIVGFCRYAFDNRFSPEIKNADCELCAIYVKLDLKKSGIGTKMFKYVVNEFRNKNKSKMILWCLKDNEESKKFYTKMGGKIIKVRKIMIGEKQYQECCFEYNI